MGFWRLFFKAQSLLINLCKTKPYINHWLSPDVRTVSFHLISLGGFGSFVDPIFTPAGLGGKLETKHGRIQFAD